jgi:hypothetical protein
LAVPRLAHHLTGAVALEADLFAKALLIGPNHTERISTDRLQLLHVQAGGGIQGQHSKPVHPLHDRGLGVPWLRAVDASEVTQVRKGAGITVAVRCLFQRAREQPKQ